MPKFKSHIVNSGDPTLRFCCCEFHPACTVRFIASADGLYIACELHRALAHVEVVGHRMTNDYAMSGTEREVE